MRTLQALAERPIREWARVEGVFTDIDDTLTTNGKLTSGVFAAMEALRAAGLIVVPVTGRPAGWCDMIARQWPVDAVIGENGALYFRYDEKQRRMLRGYADAADVRAGNRQKLAALGEEIVAAVPGARLSADQAYREADLAIDYCEDVPPLAPEDVQKITQLFEAGGATAKVSSIHVNGWFGAYDKLTMVQQMMSELFDTDLSAARDRYVFVGDSPNDAPLFAFFPDAVGVANVRELAEQCAALPRWITRASHGAGFVELADTLLSALK